MTHSATDMPLSSRLKSPGRLVLAGFDGTDWPAHMAAALQRGRIGGTILFSRNIETASQTARLVQDILSTGIDTRPIVAVDQEGGRVQRLAWTHWPEAKVLGATQDMELCRRVGRAMGAELASCGFDMDFAPVLDLDTNPENPVIGDRAFGRTPAAAGPALAWAAGLMASGVAGCGKHFPGHGDTNLDSHEALPRVDQPANRLESIELEPFRRAADRLPCIMTAHVLYPALDPTRPATLSHTILDQILRRRLGFEGLIVSDDLEMAGARAFGNVPQLAIESVAAGANLVLVCIHSDLALEAGAALEKEASRSPAFRALVDQSLARLDAFRKRFPGPDPNPERAGTICGSRVHRTLADQARRLADQQTGSQ